MSRVSRRSLIGLASTLALLVGCSGKVSLGGKGTSGSSADNEAPPGGEPDASGSATVARLPSLWLANIAVAGDYLFFTGFQDKRPSGLYRCDKSRCKPTLELLVQGNLAYSQVFDGRLGLSTFGSATYGFTTFALPDASDPRVVLDGLPSNNATPAALFTTDFIYFALVTDGNIYRCAQPDCAAGPELVAPLRSDDFTALHAEADWLFWSDRSFIYRAGDHGRAPARTLRPDEQLSEATAEATQDTPSADSIESIAVGDGMLYASVARSQNGLPCDGSCPHEIVGWPIDGGQRQVFFRNDTPLRSVTIVDGELVWLAGSPEAPEQLDNARISSCRIEACEATQRGLGEVKAEHTFFAADDQDLYWIETRQLKKGDDEVRIEVDEIRRAPRLPKP